MTHTCLVLAGGLGTRMSEFTSQMPKAVIPVAGVPFIHHQLDLLATQGVGRVVFSIGYLGDMIIKELKNHPHPGLDIEFISDGDRLLGTGGAIRNILENVEIDDFFFITYGDSYLLINLDELVLEFDALRFDALMTLYPNTELLDHNNARMHQDGSAFYKKNVPEPATMNLDMVDFGMSYVSRQSILSVIPQDDVYDLATYFEKISMEGRLQGKLVPHRFYEIGSPAGRDALELLLLNKDGEHG